MTLPTSEPLPPEREHQPLETPSRRTARAHGASTAPAERLDVLKHQTEPAFDFYLAITLSAIFFGSAFALDSPVLFLLGLLMAPFCGPVIGIALSSLVGTWGSLLSTLGSIILGGLIAWGCGAVGGWINHVTNPDFAGMLLALYGRFGWLEWAVTGLGAFLVTFALVRSPRQRPLLVNLLMAYGLIIPLSVSGFGLGAQNFEMFILGLSAFVINLATALMVAWLTLVAMRLRPVHVLGYLAIPALTLMLVVGRLGFLAGRGAPLVVQATPTPLVSPVAVVGSTPSPIPVTPSPNRPTSTLTITLSLQPTLTPSATLTPEPTPVWARVAANVGGGAFVRAEPDGSVVTSLLNDSLVQVISDPVAGKGGILWVKVRTQNGVEGWMVQSLLVTATPAPGR